MTADAIEAHIRSTVPKEVADRYFDALKQSEKLHKADTGAVRSCEYSGGEGRPEKNRLDLILKNREMMESLAEAYARGMRKYGRDNWKKGFKESILLQHALDHLIHYTNGTCDPGEEDVDQLSGVLWNVGALCWTRKNRPDLCDVTGPDPGPEDKKDPALESVMRLAGSPALDHA